MSDKLKELTDRLYQQGLSKGREEGEQILAKAREEAEQTIAKARQEAASIIAQAQIDADYIKSKAASDVKMASAQCLQTTKMDIENLLVGGLTDVTVLSDPDFLKGIIISIAEKFSAQTSADIALVLPNSLKDKLEPWVAGELKKALSCKISASFSKKISGGFTIGPADGGYFVSMTDETFSKLISEYLRPVTRKLLFGE